MMHSQADIKFSAQFMVCLSHFYRNVQKLPCMLGCFEQLQSELEYEDLEKNLKE